MTTFCIAYKNDYTTEIARRQGDAKNGWQRISAFISSWDEIKRLYDIRCAEFSINTAVAIFISHENSDRPWFTRQPRYIHNRPAIVKNTPIVGLEGLINSRESDWF